MSPLQIEILLWHYGRVDQYPEWGRGSAQAEIKQWMLDEGLLDTECSDLHITEKGKALVHAWCVTPLPVLVSEWKVPQR